VESLNIGAPNPDRMITRCRRCGTYNTHEVVPRCVKCGGRNEFIEG
jgi:ribosomal protein L37E